MKRVARLQIYEKCYQTVRIKNELSTQHEVANNSEKLRSFLGSFNHLSKLIQKFSQFIPPIRTTAEEIRKIQIDWKSHKKLKKQKQKSLRQLKTGIQTLIVKQGQNAMRLDKA